MFNCIATPTDYGVTVVGHTYRPTPRKKPVLRPTHFMAGDEGFEPPIMGPEPTALPLG